MSLPVERILWAKTNSAHHDHLHVVGDPRVNGTLADCNSNMTRSIQIIIRALDERFGKGGHHQHGDADSFGWTHMGVYNCRYIAGTTTPSQHAFANAVDIGPYYGVEEQQVFYDFLIGKENEDNSMLPLKKGMSNEDVRLIQSMLNTAYKTSLTKDGVYGDATAAVIKQHVGGDGNTVNGPFFNHIMHNVAQDAARTHVNRHKNNDPHGDDSGSRALRLARQIRIKLRDLYQ